MSCIVKNVIKNLAIISTKATDTSQMIFYVISVYSTIRVYPGSQEVVHLLDKSN